MARRSAKLLGLRRKAKKEGWLKYVREGAGEEADERAMLNGCRFSQRRADHICEFVDKYATLTEGEWKGQPFTLLPWQEKFLQESFGWVQWSHEWERWVRRFRFLYAELPKKSGKTPLLATLSNYLLFADTERQVNVYLAATTRKQAERCLIHAVRQVRNNSSLAQAATIRKIEGFHSITYKDNTAQVVAADPASADGVNGHCLADE